MHSYTRLVETYLPPGTIHTRRWQFWCKICRCWATLESSGIIKEILWNCVGSNRKQILWNYARMGLQKQNSWLEYAKLRSYKTKGVWPPQAIKTTTCAAQSATTFFQFTKTCTCRQLTPIDKSMHKTYTTDRRIFLILRTGYQTHYNQTINTLTTHQFSPTENINQDVKHFLDYCATHPDAKIRFFCIRNDPTSPLRRVINEWDQGT